jgi:hypothetical protein
MQKESRRRRADTLRAPVCPRFRCPSSPRCIPSVNHNVSACCAVLHTVHATVREYCKTVIFWTALGGRPPPPPDRLPKQLPTPARIRSPMQLFFPTRGINLHMNAVRVGSARVVGGSVQKGGWREAGPPRALQQITVFAYSSQTFAPHMHATGCCFGFSRFGKHCSTNH